ncbi:MAG TPA: phytanoyl-CoA dioxygenase family protein [Candidatus Bathyarchaeia archaeon]|nr:phytanoyl-CoA dioxygenase family protein [Candidatus Bathyarchaeia archaeon]
MLSTSDVAFYGEQGYLVVPDALDASTLSSIRAEMARILDRARHVTAHTDMYDLETGHRADDPRVRRVKTPHRFFPMFQRLMRHPRLVAILQDLLGPAVRLHGSKINLKSPRYGSPVEWHQATSGGRPLQKAVFCSTYEQLVKFDTPQLHQTLEIRGCEAGRCQRRTAWLVVFSIPIP